MDILKDVEQTIGQMDEAAVRAELAKIAEAQAKRKVKQVEYNAKPEVQAKRKAYSEEYRKKNPDKFREQRKAYMQKPEVKAKMKAYRKQRNARQKAILARAKELGINVEVAPPSA